MRPLHIAVVGATGLVGRAITAVLTERAVPVNRWRLLGSPRSAGQRLPVGETEQTVLALGNDSFDGVDVAFFSAGTEVSREFAPIAAAAGAVVIDNSAAFRMDPAVPLVVPEVNAADAMRHTGIIANPNCSTIQCVVALAPLADHFGLGRVSYATYQAASGAGADGLRALADPADRALGHPLPGNLIPQIDVFEADGYTREEHKMINETRKILHLPQLPVTATCVRVPVSYGHSVAMAVELERPATPEAARALLREAPGVVVLDDPASAAYPMPVDVAGRDEVFVGRIRADRSTTGGLHLWVVADNVRKGAATNAVQILQSLASSGAFDAGAGR